MCCVRGRGGAWEDVSGRGRACVHAGGRTCVAQVRAVACTGARGPCAGILGPVRTSARAHGASARAHGPGVGLAGGARKAAGASCGALVRGRACVGMLGRAGPWPG